MLESQNRWAAEEATSRPNTSKRAGPFNGLLYGIGRVRREALQTPSVFDHFVVAPSSRESSASIKSTRSASVCR
jgi:hypothetical protein